MAGTLPEMLVSGLPEIAAYLRCGSFSGSECRQKLSEAYPKADQTVIVQAFSWVSAAKDAADKVNRGGSALPFAAMPGITDVEGTARATYDVLTDWNNPDNNERIKRRIKIESDKPLTKEELEQKAKDAILAKDEGKRGDESPTINQVMDLLHTVVLATWHS